MKNEWWMSITRANNGYYIEHTGDDEIDSDLVIEDQADDELASGEELLWDVMDFFALRGSKHDPERLKVIREKREEE